MSLAIISIIVSSLNLGLLSSLILWQRLINYGDSLAHSMIFALILEYYFGLPRLSACFFFSIFFAVLSGLLANKKQDNNTSVAVLSSALIALSIIARDLSNGKLLLTDFIFGDIFAVSHVDLMFSIIALFSLVIFLVINFNKIIVVSLSEELAKVTRIDPFKIKLKILLITGISIGLYVHMVGVLLLTAFLIIPGATARLLSKSPSGMIILSSLISLSAAFLAYIGSYLYDISYAASAVFILANAYYCVFIKDRIQRSL